MPDEIIEKVSPTLSVSTVSTVPVPFSAKFAVTLEVKTGAAAFAFGTPMNTVVISDIDSKRENDFLESTERLIALMFMFPP